MSETQYNNLINIITNYPQMPVSQVFNAEMSEANIMAALFSNTFTVGEGVSGYFLKYKYTDVYSDLESRVLYYNNDMVKLGKKRYDYDDYVIPAIYCDPDLRGSKEENSTCKAIRERRMDQPNRIEIGPAKNRSIVDLDISYYNSQNIIKYYFLMDLLSEFYGSLAKNRTTNKITIRSRYTIVNGEWTIIPTNEIFTFDIQFGYDTMAGVSRYMIVNAQGEDITTVIDMCNVFSKDIMKHLNYLNKEDITKGNKEYLQSIQVFYKFCRLKIVYYTLACAAEVNKSVNNFINLKLAYCFLNLKNNIPMKSIDSQSIVVANQMTIATAKLQDYNTNIHKKNDVVKKNQKIRRTYENNYAKIIMYVAILISIIFVISALVIYYFSDQNTSDNFIAIAIILLTMTIYSIMHVFVKINTIERFETTTVTASGLRKFPITPATNNNKYQSVSSTGGKVNIQIKGSSSAKVNDQWKLFDANPDTDWANDSSKYTQDDTIIPVQVILNWNVNQWNDKRSGQDVSFANMTPLQIKDLQSSKTITETTSKTTTYNIDKSKYTFNVDEFIMIDLGEKVSIMGYNIKTLKLDYSPKTFKLLATNNANLYASDKISISSNYDIEPYNNNEWVILHDEQDAQYTLGDNQFYSSINFELNYRITQYPIIPTSHISDDGTLNILQQPKDSGGGYYHIGFYDIDKVHNIKVLSDIQCEILVVGGGGSGGTRNGGGGGAGTVIYQKDYMFKRGNYDLVIGKGGDRVASGSSKCGNNGGDTTIKNKDTGEEIFRAKGGGGGGGGISGDQIFGKSGGSSGGSSVEKLKGALTDIANDNIPQKANGNQGGYGKYGEYFKDTDLLGAGGGGGGAGSVGENSYTRYGLKIVYINGGNGGDGIQIDITGSNLYYGGGGGGGIVSFASTDGTTVTSSSGKGGQGGGGDGSIGKFNSNGNLNLQSKTISSKIYTSDTRKPLIFIDDNGTMFKNGSTGQNFGISPDLVNFSSFDNTIFHKGSYKYLVALGKQQNFFGVYNIKVYNNGSYTNDYKPEYGETYIENGKLLNSSPGYFSVSRNETIDGKNSTGGGGGGGGTILGVAKTDEEGDNSTYNGMSGAGGSGVIIIKYKVDNPCILDTTPYRYYALKVIDSKKSIANLKMSELELLGGTEEEMQKYTNTYQFYKGFINPQTEISSEVQAAIDRAKAKLQEKIDIEKANAETIKSLQDQLANSGGSNYMNSELERIRQETIAKQLEATQAQGRIDAAETARARDELLANEQKLLKEQIIAQQQILQDQIDKLTSNFQTLKNLESQINDPIYGSNLLNKLQQELAAAEVAKVQAENRLTISKAQEAADKLLIDQEKAINNEYSIQLSRYLLDLTQARKRKDDAFAAKELLRASYSTATVVQQQVVDAELEAATAEERRQNQLYLTNQARLATEAKQRLADVRKQALELLATQLANVIADYNTTENNILLALQQNEQIEYNTSNAVVYTSNYLINSSNQYTELESERNATISALQLDISNIQRDVAIKMEEIKVSIRNAVQDRAASEDIQKNLTKLAMELANYMIEKQNYKYGTNVLSITTTSEDIKTKMSVNIQNTMTQIANNIVLTGVKRELVEMSTENSGSVIAAERSRGDVEELRRDNRITVATCKFILNLFVLSMILLMIQQKFSLNSLMSMIVIIYIVLFIFYIIEVIQIVRTRSFQKYWQKPGQRQFL